MPRIAEAGISFVLIEPAKKYLQRSVAYESDTPHYHDRRKRFLRLQAIQISKGKRNGAGL
jgi:hypothetical protein